MSPQNRNRNLVDGERILARVGLHPAVFLYPAMGLITGVLVGVFFHWIVGGAILFLCLYPVTDALIRFKTTSLILTDRRVIIEYGFFNRDLIQFRLDKIESAFLETPLWGRFLGFATVNIRGTGAGRVPVVFVRDGDAFVRAVEARLLAAEKQGKGSSE